MTMFCHSSLSVGGESRKGITLNIEEELRKAIRHYRETGGEEKEILVLITDLSAKYSSDPASTWKLAAMLMEESVNVK
jgi:hypothetical protein